MRKWWDNFKMAPKKKRKHRVKFMKKIKSSMEIIFKCLLLPMLYNKSILKLQISNFQRTETQSNQIEFQN